MEQTSQECLHRVRSGTEFCASCPVCMVLLASFESSIFPRHVSLMNHSALVVQGCNLCGRISHRKSPPAILPLCHEPLFTIDLVAFSFRSYGLFVVVDMLRAVTTVLFVPPSIQHLRRAWSWLWVSRKTLCSGISSSTARIRSQGGRWVFGACFPLGGVCSHRFGGIEVDQQSRLHLLECRIKCGVAAQLPPPLRRLRFLFASRKVA